MKLYNLREIPRALFEEFGLHQTAEADHFAHVGGEYDILVAAAQCEAQEMPLRFVLKNFFCSAGRMHSTTLMAFDSPVRSEQFKPSEDTLFADPVLTIKFHAEDPPYRPRPSLASKWQLGRGYWVGEMLDVEFNASVISPYADMEFLYLLSVQKRAHELARAVPVRGHWQSEWNPHADYNTRPSRR